MAGMLAAWCLSCMILSGGDWPMRLHDAARGGVTSESLSVPLSRGWTHTTRRGPAPAWTESPARHDYLHNYYDLKPRQGFDRCFDVAVAKGRVYFGSSRSGAVTCLLARDNGKVAWTFFTDAPVRFAPQIVGEKLYVGSDDGYMYCLDAHTGTLVWKERAGPTSEMLWGNEHMISLWPVRTGVLVVDDHVYWTAGLFPEQGVYMCRRKAADGTGGWTHPLTRPAQGYLLASADRLFVPTGKTFPLVFNRQTGTPLGDVKKTARDGGCWALIEPETCRIWSGPSTDNALQGFNSKTGTQIATIRGANCLVIDGEYAFYNTDSHVVKVDRFGSSIDRRGNKKVRPKGKILWSQEAAFPHSLIKSGALLFAGGANRVAAFGTDGKQRWEAPVDGNAFGLAVADGCLYVSTDTGSIHCFKATLPHLIGKAQAARVDDGTAEITGRLDSVGGAPTSVTLYWGRTNGGTEPDAWQQRAELGGREPGTFTAKIGVPEPDAVHYWRFAATNSYGTAWEATAGTFTTGEVSVAAADATASEHGLDPASFTVSRSGRDVSLPLTVYYTAGGTAEPGSDYSRLSGKVIIPPGSRTAAITVMPCDDLLLDEPDKTVVITIASGPYRVGAENMARIIISDQDSMDGWQYRAKLTATGYSKGKVLRGFPALVHVGDNIPGFRRNQLTDKGADLRFTDAGVTTVLPYEIDSWTADGTARIWVRIPALAPTTSIWVWWGNPHYTSPPAYTTDGSTWAPDCVGAWHMDADSGNVRDASSAGNHGHAKDVRRDAPGVIGQGLEFDGAKGAVKLTSILPIGKGDNTVSLWVNVPKAGSGGLTPKERVGIILGNFNDTPNSNWEIHATGEMRWHWNRGRPDQRGKTDLRDGTWHHLAWVRERQSDRLHVYVDGELEKEGKDAGADITFTTRHAIGADNRPKGSPRFHGKMDELRVSQAARSPDWIRACFANQSSPDTFWTCGPATDPRTHK